MAQSYESSRPFRLGPGAGLNFSKYFGPISGLHTKLFITFKSNVCFLSWRRFVVVTAAQYFCEWIGCDFSSVNSDCKHSYVLLLTAGISLTLFLRRWQRWGN